MAAVPGFRALFSLRRLMVLQQTFWLNVVPLTTCLPRRLYSVTTKCNEPKKEVNKENVSLLESLCLLGVDVNMARKRQPGVFRKNSTNEQGVIQFLQSKGASNKVIASIISRYPRAITRSDSHLNQRWQLWRKIFSTDDEIVNTLNRSPESFFRSSDNGNLEMNIAFLTSLGIHSKDLYRLLATAPRTFSNSLELNKQMVKCLEDICVELGGQNPEQFAKSVISRNPYIFIRSTKSISKNINTLRTSLNMSNIELLDLLQGYGVEILDLSNEYLKKNIKSLQRKMASLGCNKSDFKKMIINSPGVLYIGSNTLSSKLDCLLKGGITMNQLLQKGKVLELSTKNITGRLEELQKVGYDFNKNSISILDCSQKRFVAKMEKLASLQNN